MFNTNQEIRDIEELYKLKLYNEAINICNINVDKLNPNNTADHHLLSIFNDRLFNCYFRMSKEDQCRWYLSECVRFAPTDREQYIAFHNNIRLDVNTIITDKTFLLIEDCLKYYRAMDDEISIADILILKGKATKDVRYLKEAIEIYKNADFDTSDEQERAMKLIHNIRHLK